MIRQEQANGRENTPLENAGDGVPGENQYDLVQDALNYGNALLSTDGNRAWEEVFRDAGAMIVRLALALHRATKDGPHPQIARLQEPTT